MNPKALKFHLRGPFVAAAVLIGVFLICVVLVSATQSDMEMAEVHLSDTANYVHKQCAMYSSLNKASETKSLMRITMGVQQIERNLSFSRKEDPQFEADEALLEHYTSEQYLSGVTLLQPDGTLVAAYDDGTSYSDKLDAELEKDTLLDVAAHPEKTYMVRLECDDGTYVDLAACGRKDEPGLIVGYYHTPMEYITGYTLSVQNLLSGYSMENDGVIVVTRGNRVIASNDESLVGLAVNDVPTLRNIHTAARNAKMVHVLSGDSVTNQSFGVINRGRDYYVYAYQSERSVFETTPRKLLFAVIGYVLALMFVQAVGWKMTQQYREAQQTQERAYQEKLVEAARRAESANVAKTEFLQRMSHDIRTPINGIRGMVEIGNHYPDDAARQAECRRKIWDASGLLLELVNEVLDMGKLESGEVVLEQRAFYMVALLDEVSNALERSAAERAITITRAPRVLPHPVLVGSPLHLKRLLMNILSNAVKYNREGGSIRLSARELHCDDTTAWIEFVCADTGIGMSEEYQKHLFEPFTQESSNARSTYGGTGLGMAITKSLVDKMNGQITFRSKQGEGTTFRVVLPLRIGSEAAIQRPQMQDTAASLVGMRVLLVEDNELNMEIAQFLLENAGATVMKAWNGQQAVEMFARADVGTLDAILMDVMMPVLDGYAATRQIRAMDRADAKTVPIIAMTANAFAEDRKKAHDAGMDEHLTKPLEPVLVRQTLARYRNKQS